jgi:hypothetical protein
VISQLNHGFLQSSEIFPFEMFEEPLLEILSRQHAKSAKKKYFPVSPTLAHFASLR